MIKDEEITAIADELRKLAARLSQQIHRPRKQQEVGLVDTTLDLVLTKLIYPYRARSLAQSVREVLPNSTRTQVAAAMHARGYIRHRDQQGIAWITGRVTAAPAPPATPQPDL